MKPIQLLSLLPALSGAVPTPQDDPPFTVMAIRSASPIHYSRMTARGLSIWLGGETASYCPTQVEPNCPPGNETVLTANGNAMVCHPESQTEEISD